MGEGLTEADIVTWHVQLGDHVSVNDTILEVETAKSVVELPSPFEGFVLKLHAKEGDTLPVGAPLITIGATTVAGGRSQARRSPSDEPVSAQSVHDDAGTATSPVLTASGLITPDAPADRLPSEAQPVAPLILVGTGPKKAAGRRVRLRRPEHPVSERPVADASAATQLTGGLQTTGTDARIPVKGVRKRQSPESVET